jgi:hypothetical protein
MFSAFKQITKGNTMSTRCNINIKNYNTNIWLYRHHDGYLSETGYNLACNLIHSKDSHNFLENLLSEKYEASENQPAKKIYELTSSQHGDIEYLYTFDFSNNNNWVNVYIEKLEYTDSPIKKPKTILEAKCLWMDNKDPEAMPNAFKLIFEERRKRLFSKAA